MISSAALSSLYAMISKTIFSLMNALSMVCFRIHLYKITFSDPCAFKLARPCASPSMMRSDFRPREKFRAEEQTDHCSRFLRSNSRRMLIRNVADDVKSLLPFLEAHPNISAGDLVQFSAVVGFSNCRGAPQLNF